MATHLRIYLQSYGMPGDVEKIDISSPATISAWRTEAKKAVEEHAGFLEVTRWVPPGAGTGEHNYPGEDENPVFAIQVDRVESVHVVEDAAA